MFISDPIKKMSIKDRLILICFMPSENLARTAECIISIQGSEAYVNTFRTWEP